MRGTSRRQAQGRSRSRWLHGSRIAATSAKHLPTLLRKEHRQALFGGLVFVFGFLGNRVQERNNRTRHQKKRGTGIGTELSAYHIIESWSGGSLLSGFFFSFEGKNKKNKNGPTIQLIHPPVGTLDTASKYIQQARSAVLGLVGVASKLTSTSSHYVKGKNLLRWCNQIHYVCWKSVRQQERVRSQSVHWRVPAAAWKRNKRIESTTPENKRSYSYIHSVMILHGVYI